ncbi:hypothetical protein [Archangium violaceum]|uniref:hypothetical protein n=1 Tax=Archangium violaceum TaxID=83451 RepID=UPI0036DE3A17
MSRNMTETNKKVFSKLTRLVEQAGVAHHVPALQAPRWIKTSDEEKDLLKNANHETSIECLPGKWASLISHKAQLLIVLPESQSATSTLKDVRSHTPNAGLLTLLWSLDSYNPISINDVGAKIAENLYGVSGGYEASAITPYFQPLMVFETDRHTRGDDPESLVYKVYGAFLLGRSADIPLPYSTPTRARIIELLEGECGNIASDILFRAITASHWTHAFLDFYRCIERLYQAPYVEELRKGLGTASHLSLGEQISKSLDWRPKEDHALKRLLKDLANTAIITRLHGTFCKSQPTPNSDLSDSVGGSIYKIRNGIAHFRSSKNSTQTFNAIEWDQAIEVLCELISELYKAYGSIIRV